MTEPLKEYGSFQLAHCGNPKCDGVHIMLFDKPEDKIPVAVCSFHVDGVPEIIRSLQSFAYKHAAEKDD
jgi:hypothetical protein